MNNNQKPKINYVKIIITVLIIAILIVIGKSAMDYYCSHDTHETVATKSMFDNKTKYITVSSLKFHIPSKINVGIGDNYFTVDDNDNQYVIRVEIQDAEFEYLQNNISTLKGNIDATYNSKAKIQNYNGKDYIVVETADWLSKTLIAFTKATDEKILAIAIINNKNTYDYELLKEFTTIINEIDQN